MNQQTQQILAIPGGDCLRACIASILEAPIEDVPNFAAEDDWVLKDGEWSINGLANDDPPGWWTALGTWLATRGLFAFQGAHPPTEKWGITGLPDGAYCIATIHSPRSEGTYHCVVANPKTGDVVWDPWPGAEWTEPLNNNQVVDWIHIVRPH